MRLLLPVLLVAGLLMPTAASAAIKFPKIKPKPKDDAADACLKVNTSEAARSTKKAARECALQGLSTSNGSAESTASGVAAPTDGVSPVQTAAPSDSAPRD